MHVIPAKLCFFRAKFYGYALKINLQTVKIDITILVFL